MSQDVRWKQRFQNFDRALVLLREPVDQGIATLSALEKEGTVQRFVFTLELAWKTLKDYLEHEGRPVEPVTPRAVIKEAFAARILGDGQVWIDMITHRNLLSHTYDAKAFDATVQAVQDRYLPAFEDLHLWLMERLAS
ncbi:nucleotidyltransferase substrate binding protein [Pararhodospirillum oryzae]|uniref:Nucleotidyltransferase n=1 Tax=Pararhodospirillum oryzae TaxID=478448 RepID=A0A512H6M9_9PROT|nr:nucleotidyltransferase substrate binding protein [Pararhodospirillum oryzae]GEO81097.1 nucleotidyltransferase [Pararhodospirillum oryzae]